jgi:hypothetical protein
VLRQRRRLAVRRLATAGDVRCADMRTGRAEQRRLPGLLSSSLFMCSMGVPAGAACGCNSLSPLRARPCAPASRAASAVADADAGRCGGLWWCWGYQQGLATPDTLHSPGVQRTIGSSHH